MFSKKSFIFVKSLFLLLSLQLSLLTTVYSNKTNEINERDLEQIAFNFMSMIEFKLKKGGKVNQIEIRLMDMLMNEIQKRIDMEKEREANTVYWHLRQG